MPKKNYPKLEHSAEERNENVQLFTWYLLISLKNIPNTHISVQIHCIRMTQNPCFLFSGDGTGAC